MLKILLFFLVILILLMIFTQIIVPIFVSNLPFFWIFKKDYYFKKSTNIKELNDLDAKAQAATEHYKEAISDLKETEDRLNQIKKQTKI